MEKTYFLTVFDSSGETLLNEKITTDSDEKAKELGRHLLIEQQYTKHSHRLVNDAGKLLLFER
ncbi:YhzD family protein [Bacillus sp. FSL M8-0077]|uniref:YhzD family protein n=1 Tax=Bacillus sp. FSL M8-0077 TaxID=2954556 RepID=UPI001150747F